MKPNRSAAVVQQRHTPAKDLDYFPTPPWATRALLKEYPLSGSIWEPACGEGWMAETLKETNSDVFASDIFNYGYGSVIDFLATHRECDWVVTNPPFNLAEEFIKHSLEVASKGCAMLCRLSLLESKGRYERLFSINPPTTVLVFSERVPMFDKYIDLDGASAMSTAWFIWDKQQSKTSNLRWIPSYRKELTTKGDYERVQQWNKWIG